MVLSDFCIESYFLLLVYCHADWQHRPRASGLSQARGALNSTVNHGNNGIPCTDCFMFPMCDVSMMFFLSEVKSSKNLIKRALDCTDFAVVDT